MTAQAAPVDARQIVADTLTDMAVRIDTRWEIVDGLYDLFDSDHGALTPHVVVALIAAAFADREVTAALLEDLATASTRLERHRDTRGHDECCGGDCMCLGPNTPRCRHCENDPAATLWQAQRDLTDHLDHLHSLDDLLRAAGGAS